MKVGDFVIEPMGLVEYEPRMYQIRAVTRGRAELARVNPTDGVVSEIIKVDVYKLRSYRHLAPEEREEFRRLVFDLRTRRVACRNFVTRLPLVADVG